MEDDGYRPTVRLTRPYIKVTDAGTWAAGANWGWRLITQAINIAGDLGYYIDAEARRAMQCYDTYAPCSDADGDGYCNHIEVTEDVYREAENWLNERAPARYSFACWDGDFGMWEVCPESGEWVGECHNHERDNHG